MAKLNEFEFVKRKYETDVKPAVDGEDYFVAEMEMANIVDMICASQITKYKNGLTLKGRAKVLKNSLSKNKIDSDKIKRFEETMSFLEKSIEMGETY